MILVGELYLNRAAHRAMRVTRIRCGAACGNLSQCHLDVAPLIITHDTFPLAARMAEDAGGPVPMPGMRPLDR